MPTDYIYGVTPVEVADRRTDHGRTIPDEEVMVWPNEAAAKNWIADWEAGGNGVDLWVIVRKLVVQWETY